MKRDRKKPETEAITSEALEKLRIEIMLSEDEVEMMTEKIAKTGGTLNDSALSEMAVGLENYSIQLMQLEKELRERENAQKDNKSDE